MQYLVFIYRIAYDMENPTLMSNHFNVISLFEMTVALKYVNNFFQIALVLVLGLQVCKAVLHNILYECA